MGNLGRVLIGRAKLSKSSIQFSIDGQGCVPSLLFDLRPNYGGGNEDNGDLLQKVPCTYCYTQCPQPCSRPLLTHTSARDSLTLMGKSGSVSCGVTTPFFWVLMHTGFVCALQESVSPVLCKFWWLNGGVNGNILQESFCHTQICCTQSPCHCSSPSPIHATARDSWTLTCKSRLVSCGVTAAFSCFLVPTRFCLCFPRVCFPSPV